MLKEKAFISLQTIIPRVVECYAHVDSKGKKERETLIEHTELCQKYFIDMCKNKKVDKIIERFIKLCLGEISVEARNLFISMLMNTVTFHDVGKINPEFQRIKMKWAWETQIKKHVNVNSKHSLISAIIYRDYFEVEIRIIKNKEEQNILDYFSFLNSYIISRHHSGLGSLKDYFTTYLDGDGRYATEWLNEWIEKFYGKTIKDMGINKRKKERMTKHFQIEENGQEKAIYLYMYMRLLYSLLVAADYYATTEYMSGLETKDFGNFENLNEFMELYEGTELNKSIRDYKPQKNILNSLTNINVLRTEIFLETEKILLNNLGQNIYYLEAPTGSGKSNTAFNVSFQLAKSFHDEFKLEKLFYIYPFNTLVEQNLDILKKTFGNSEVVMKQMAVVNSLYPIKVDEDLVEDVEMKYQEALLDRQFLNYPMILSTHVSLFKTLFSAKREDVFGFYQLANSIIVLDEIQSYRIDIWSEIIRFLKRFAEILNIKVVIMSATLPNLEILDNGKKDDAIRLIQNPTRYFEHKLFRSRVKANYDLLDDNYFTIEKLEAHILETMRTGKTILVEFIKKNQAMQFYHEVNQKNIDYEIHLMTGDDNLIERKKTIGRVKEKKDKIILIATQVVEAGVDIDMQVGYKDISKLDSEEQFMGRINRSCKNSEPGIAYFFNLAEAKNIYRDDKIRLNKELTLANEDMRDLLAKKEFGKFYERFLFLLRELGERSEGALSTTEFFREKVAKLNFTEIDEHMQLIQDDMHYIDVFLARDMEDEQGGIISGQKTWQRYRELLGDVEMSYAKRAVELSEVRSKMNYFIYRIYGSGISEVSGCPQMGDLYYIEDGERYFENGKFNREKFSSSEPEFY